jgi:hypothetical protein
MTQVMPHVGPFAARLRMTACHSVIATARPATRGGSRGCACVFDPGVEGDNRGDGTG